jgi:Transglycosylase SLT domain
MMQSGPKIGQHEKRLPTLAIGLVALGLMAGCVPSDPAGAALRALGMSGPDAPATRWDHRPEAPGWTSAALMAVAAEDDVLAGRVPGDIAEYCPAYPKADLADRRAFWVGLLSAIAKYESSWNPAASGGGGRYIGLMQISPRSAANYGCEATSRSALKDGSANLACAVRMVSYHVERDALVAGRGNRGVGRDWMPLRNAAKRGEIADWVGAQAYCKA